LLADPALAGLTAPSIKALFMDGHYLSSNHPAMKIAAMLPLHFSMTNIYVLFKIQRGQLAVVGKMLISHSLYNGMQFAFKTSFSRHEMHFPLIFMMPFLL